MAAELNAKDTEKAQFTFSIYDLEGKSQMDAFYIGDALRALNLIPTMKALEKLGQTKKAGEKKLKLDEFLGIFATAKKDKDVGNISDYVEVLKLYDKENDGTMMLAELEHVLQSLGETLAKDEVEGIVKDCADPADEDGFFKYGTFLKRLMAGPFPDSED